jgi:multidrug efflux system outer membrane protein
MTGSLSILLLSVAVWSGCAVGPNYKRPAVDVPGTYRGASTEAPTTSEQNTKPPTPQRAAASLGDEKWGEVFQDEELRKLIHTALKNNYDVRIAATRILEAQAQLGITRADQYPSLGVGASVADQRSPKIGPIPSFEVSLGQVTASAAWNLDFWGRYRRATEAARANLLANEWAQRQVMATLVANVATAYFQLRILSAPAT